jgi:hypothetical protein
MRDLEEMNRMVEGEGAVLLTTQEPSTTSHHRRMRRATSGMSAHE